MILKDSKFYLLSSLFTVCVNFFTLPIFTAYLSVADYGVVGLFLLFGSTIFSLIAFGLNTATYGLYFKYSEVEFRSLNTTVFIFLNFVFIVVGLICVFPLANDISSRIFNNQLDENLIRLSFLNGYISYFYTFYGQLLVAQKRTKVFSALVIFQVLLNALLTFYFIIYHSFTYEAPIYGVLISNFIVLLISLFCNKNLFVLNFSKSKIKKALVFGTPEVPNVIVSLLYGAFDRLMLVNYKGLNDIGYYEFGNRFAGILKIFIDALGKSFSPFFLEKSNEKNDTSKYEIINAFYNLSFILGFIGLGVAYFSEEALVILTTPEFYVSKYLVPALVAYYLFGIIGQLSMNQLIAAEKLYYLAPISIVGLTVNIAVNIFLIPSYGVYGAVLSTVISSFITSLLLFYYGNKAFPLPIDITKLIRFFFVLISFLAFSYPALMTDYNYFIKLIIKLCLLGAFCLVSFKLRYADISQMIVGFRRIKIAFKKF